jgi:hypothetical protein
MLGEFDGEPMPRTLVPARKVPFNDLFGLQFQAVNLG